MPNLMESKRLDLDVPLLSVRRHPVQSPVKLSTKLQEPAVKPATPSCISAVPFYKSDLKTGPVRNPGVVPFVWEQMPGKPKASTATRDGFPQIPPLPPGRIPNIAEPDGPSSKSNSDRENMPLEDAAAMTSEELLKVKIEDNFSTAFETISSTESFSMNCSLSGISGIPDTVVPSGSFSTDTQVRDLMMDRFLPAAQAMASGSPQYFSRKPAKLVDRTTNGEHRLPRAPLPYQHRPKLVGRYPHDEIDSSGGDDYHNNYEGLEHFTSKACGLLPWFCMKSSFYLLNPMPGMKVENRRRGLPPSTSRKISSVLHNNGPLSKAEDELWEAVYKKKLRPGIHHQREDGRKITTKSYQHDQWSDSLTLGGSSSCHHSGSSREVLVDMPKIVTQNGKSDASESLNKDGESYSTVSSSHVSQQGSGICSPTTVNSVRVENSFELEKHNELVLQPPSSRVPDPASLLCPGNSVPQAIVSQNDAELVNIMDAHLLLTGEDQLKNNSNLHSLLPIPLPKTPSDSWLSRTLPTKIPSGKSNMGIHVRQRKQSFLTSSTSPRQESEYNLSESLHPKVHFVAAKQEIPLEPCKLHQCQITPTNESSIEHFEGQIDGILDIRVSKSPRRQICFAEVLMTPLSPPSEK